jgi:hypothetical protein
MTITLEPSNPEDLDRVSFALKAALLDQHIAFSREFRDDLVRHVFRLLEGTS